MKLLQISFKGLEVQSIFGTLKQKLRMKIYFIFYLLLYLDYYRNKSKGIKYLFSLKLKSILARILIPFILHSILIFLYPHSYSYSYVTNLPLLFLNSKRRLIFLKKIFSFQSQQANYSLFLGQKEKNLLSYILCILSHFSSL